MVITSKTNTITCILPDNFFSPPDLIDYLEVYFSPSGIRRSIWWFSRPFENVFIHILHVIEGNWKSLQFPLIFASLFFRQNIPEKTRIYRYFEHLCESFISLSFFPPSKIWNVTISELARTQNKIFLRSWWNVTV